MPPYPLTINAAAPAGALPRRLQFPIFPETDITPPCRTEALRRGALPISSIYKIFMVFGANTLFTLISPERKTTHSRKCPDRKQPFSRDKKEEQDTGRRELPAPYHQERDTESNSPQDGSRTRRRFFRGGFECAKRGQLERDFLIGGHGFYRGPGSPRYDRGRTGGKLRERG